MAPKILKSLGILAGAVAGTSALAAYTFPTVDKVGEIEPDPLSDIQLRFLKGLPLRLASKLWGVCSEIPIPESLREPIYNKWCNTFHCDVKEAQLPMKSYGTLQEFFGRSLAPGVRPVDQDPKALVSPCDARVLIAGPLGHFGRLEQIKGMSYDLRTFLAAGDKEPIAKSAVDVFEPGDRKKDEKKIRQQTSQKRLYQIVLYLAPGDYHNFHAPTRWNLRKLRHVYGELLSVSPAVVRRVPGLFSLNERVVMLGDWDYGFFSMTAVGATNVGSIKLFFKMREFVRTNRLNVTSGTVHEQDTLLPAFGRGDLVGGFRLGSSIVLIFEAPESFRFCVEPGDKVSCGRPIGYIQ